MNQKFVEGICYGVGTVRKQKALLAFEYRKAQFTLTFFHEQSFEGDTRVQEVFKIYKYLRQHLKHR